MPSYIFRCIPCQIDWSKFYKMSELPRELECPECGGMMRQRIHPSPVIFNSSGFPGNDMKDLHSGSSIETRGRKPTHEELNYIEKHYPDSGDSAKAKQIVEKVIDQAKSGSKRDAMYNAHKRTR